MADANEKNISLIPTGKFRKIALILILFSALVIRLYGVNFGLPYLYDPDEGVYLSSALHMLANHDPNPHWFGAPASTTIYMLAGIVSSEYVVGKALGIFKNSEDFVEKYYEDPSFIYLAGRIACGLFGLASVYLVYLIMLRVLNLSAALMSSALLAVSPLHVEFSKLIRMDIQLTFLLLVALWYCLKILDRQDWKNYLLAGFFIGLASVTKYYGIVFVVALVLSHFMSSGWTLKHFKMLIGSFFAILVGAFIGSPFLFIDYKTALRDVLYEATYEHVSHTGEGFFHNLWWYVTKASLASVGTVGLVLAAAGFFIWIRTNKKEGVIFSILPVVFLLFLSLLRLKWERWTMPAVPFLCMLAALAIVGVGSAFQRWGRKAVCATTVLVFMIAWLPLVHSAYIQSREMSGVHTRTQAHDWIVASIPEGSKILNEIYGPQLPKNKYDVYYISNWGKLEQASKDGPANYRVGGNVGRIKDINEIRRAGMEYFVMSHMYSRFLAEKEKYPKIVQNYETVMNSATLLHKINPEPGRNRGPKLRIYRFNWVQDSN